MKLFSFDNLKIHWSFIKIFKVVLALMILVQALTSNEVYLGIFSLFFLAQALFNVGCGSPSGCAVPHTNKIEKSREDITFTALTSTKKEN
jgi:hypothetical protein